MTLQTDFRSLSEAVADCINRAGYLFRLASLSGPDIPKLAAIEVGHLGDALKRAARPLWESRREFLGLYEMPPEPIGDISEPSYHGLAFAVARKLYFDAFRNADIRHYGDHRPRGPEAFTFMECDLDPQVIADNWPAVGKWMATEAVRFDAGRLATLVEDESFKAEDRDSKWSLPDTPSQWAKKFNVSAGTMVTWFREGRIRNKRLSSKSYRVHLDDLPRK